MRVSEIRVNQMRVNQGLGVYTSGMVGICLLKSCHVLQQISGLHHRPGQSGRGFKSWWRNMIFFSVQVHYFMLFMYESMTYIDKQESKVLRYLLLITLNF